MEGHLRLAERRGLLRGHDLSPVQELGLRLLHYADNQAEHERRYERLRLALATHKPDAMPDLFPELFPNETQDVATLDDAPEGAAIDYSGVEWMSGEEAKGEYERLMAQLENDDVEVVGAGADRGGDWM